MCSLPDRKLGDIDAEVATHERIGDLIRHSLPCQRRLSPPAGCADTHQQAQKRTGADRRSEQGPGRERLAELEVGHAPADLDRADRAIHQKQMSNEPGRGDDDAGEVECKPEDVPVREVSRGLRRELHGPPAIGEQNCSPPAGEQEENDGGENAGEPPAASRQALPYRVDGWATLFCRSRKSSTSARYASRAAASVASKRMTSTGCVFEARRRPHPW